MRTVQVGVIGDFDSSKASHPATNDAIGHSAKRLGVKADIAWLPTPSMLIEKGQRGLQESDCLWASSGGPYESMDGMLKGIQIARHLDKPFIGT